MKDIYDIEDYFRIVQAVVGRDYSIEGFVHRHGQAYEYQPNPDLPRGIVRQCYYNSYRGALSNGLIYVEGFACCGYLPSEHAWNIDPQTGAVIDITWQKHYDERRTYYGVAFSNEYIRRIAAETEMYGVLHNYKQQFPLLTGKDTDFLYEGPDERTAMDKDVQVEGQRGVARGSDSRCEGTRGRVRVPRRGSRRRDA